jgi:hypothetical protein
MVLGVVSMSVVGGVIPIRDDPRFDGGGRLPKANGVRRVTPPGYIVAESSNSDDSRDPTRLNYLRRVVGFCLTRQIPWLLNSTKLQIII